MLKKISFSFLLVVIACSSLAQNADKRGWDWNKTFVGGSFILPNIFFGNNSQYIYGANPEFGYSIFRLVDIGLAGNVVFSGYSVRDAASSVTEKLRVTQLGIGVFGRLHISDGFFLHIQPEINTFKYKRFFEPDIPLLTEERKVNSSSVLAGIGWGTHDVGNVNYFTTILIDLQKDIYSPYRYRDGTVIPVIRAGINFYFNRKKR